MVAKIRQCIVKRDPQQRSSKMKRIVLIVVVLSLVAVSAFAAGGKQRGDKGKGSVHQVVGP
jgi:hypothetical protein